MRISDSMKIAGGGLSLLASVKTEIDRLVRDRIEQFLHSQDEFVTRDEFEAVKMMAQNALQDNAALKKRLGEIEKKLPSNKTKKS